MYIRRSTTDWLAKTIFTCDICSKTFTKRSYLAKHLKIHKTGKDTERPCPECGKIFTRKNLSSHMKKVHKKESQVCKHCGKTFSSKCVLRNHIAFKHIGSGKVCEFCSKKFKDLYSLKRHLSIHDSTTVMCEDCGKSVKHLDTHKKRCNKERTTETFECEDCGKSFKEKLYLQKHIKFKHSGMKRLLCDCGKTFSSRSSLNVHRKHFHILSTGPFEGTSVNTTEDVSREHISKDSQLDISEHQKLDISIKDFNQGAIISSMYQKETESLDYMENFDDCENVFSIHHREQASADHKDICLSDDITNMLACPSSLPGQLIQKASGNGSVKMCDECGMIFDNKKKLSCHVSKVHKKSAQVCEHCGMSLGSIASLTNHIRFKHSNVGKICEICSKRFKDSYSLKRHLSSHNSTTIKCEDCGKYVKHIDIHKKTCNQEILPRVYDCVECEKSFTTENI